MALQLRKMDPPRHLIGFAALLCLLIGGPLVAWRVACMLYPLRWTIAAVLAVTEWCFYIFYFRRTYEDFNRIPAVCRPKGKELLSPEESERLVLQSLDGSPCIAAVCFQGQSTSSSGAASTEARPAVLQQQWVVNSTAGMTSALACVKSES